MDDFAYQWPYTRMTQPRETGVDGLNALSALSAQIETLSKKLDVLAAQRIQKIVVTCDYCAGNHPSHQCTVSFGPVQYDGGNFNQYAYPDNYQGWGYYPDYSWSYNQQDQFYAPSPTYAPEFSCPPPLPQEENSSLEEFMSKIIANQEEMMMSQEISIQNFKNHQEQLINTSFNGPQYMDSETETDNSRLEEVWSKFVASNEERGINQEMSIKNIQNQNNQMFKALNNCPQNNWCYDMNYETDGEPEQNLQLDEPQDVEKGEISGDKENEAITDVSLSASEDELIVLVPQVPPPPKFKNPFSFAKPCPLGSHVIGEACYDMRTSTKVESWWDEEEKIEEEPVVLDKPQCPNLIIDTTEEKAPSFSSFSIGHLSKQIKLGDFNSMAITNGNLPKHTLLLMDGGFLNYRRGIG